MRPEDTRSLRWDFASDIEPSRVHRVELDSGHGYVWIIEDPLHGQRARYPRNFSVLVDERRKPICMDQSELDLVSLTQGREIGFGLSDLRLSDRDQKQIVEEMIENMPEHRSYLESFYGEPGRSFTVFMIFDA